MWITKPNFVRDVLVTDYFGTSLGVIRQDMIIRDISLSQKVRHLKTMIVSDQTHIQTFSLQVIAQYITELKLTHKRMW